VANTASLAIAGIGLLLYWRVVSRRHVRAAAALRADAGV